MTDKEAFERQLDQLVELYRLHKLLSKTDMLDILESAHNSLEEDGEE